MKLLHTMLRVKDLERALHFFGMLGLKEHRRMNSSGGRFSLVYLREEGSSSDIEIELTHNWDRLEEYTVGNSFGHIAFEVDDINQKCDELRSHGAIIARPPRDGAMAFVKTSDGLSIELLQRGGGIRPREPYVSMPNQGEW